MSCRELRTRLISGLPDHLSANLDLETRIKSACISHHGFILCVTLQGGSVIVCDARTLANQRKLADDSNPDGVCCCFTRDTQHVAVGYDDGDVRIFSVMDKALASKIHFKGAIRSLAASPKDVEKILVLTKTNELSLLTGTEVTKVPGEWTAVAWHPDGKVFYAATEDAVVVWSAEDLTRTHTHEFEDERLQAITALSVSRDARMLLITDSIGNVCVLAFESGVIGAKFAEVVDRQKKLRWAEFDWSGRFVFAVPQHGQGEAFRTYSIETGECVSYSGPASSNNGLLLSSVDPILYIMHRTGFYMYTVSIPDTPPFDVPFNGARHREKEVKMATRDFIGRAPYFPDDVDYPNQLIKLPYRECRWIE